MHIMVHVYYNYDRKHCFIVCLWRCTCAGVVYCVIVCLPLFSKQRFYMSYRMGLGYHELETQSYIPCTPIKAVQLATCVYTIISME